MEAQVQFQASTCGRKIREGPNVSPNTSCFPVSITTPMLQSYSFIHHGRSLILATDSVLRSKFLLSFWATTLFNVLVSVKPLRKLRSNVIAFLSSFRYKINEYPKVAMMRDTKACAGVEAQLHSLLSSVLDGGKQSASRPGFAPGKVSRYPLNKQLGGPHSRTRKFREEWKMFYRGRGVGVWSQFFGKWTRGLVTMLAELS